jgi:hypothetical protein
MHAYAIPIDGQVREESFRPSLAKFVGNLKHLASAKAVEHSANGFYLMQKDCDRIIKNACARLNVDMEDDFSVRNCVDKMPIALYQLTLALALGQAFNTRTASIANTRFGGATSGIVLSMTQTGTKTLQLREPPEFTKNDKRDHIPSASPPRA